MADGHRGAADVWGVPLGVFTGVAVSWVLYTFGPARLANLVIFPYAAGLVLGPGICHAWLRGRGVGPRAAVGATLLLPLAWLAKELYRVTAVFSVPEALYYALNPLSLGIFGAAALQMALSEIAWRRRHEGALRLGGGPGWTLAVIAALAVGAAALGHDSGGRDIFYAYIALYRALFPAS